jgi:hypothetical protein
MDNVKAGLIAPGWRSPDFSNVRLPMALALPQNKQASACPRRPLDEQPISRSCLRGRAHVGRGMQEFVKRRSRAPVEGNQHKLKAILHEIYSRRPGIQTAFNEPGCPVRVP